MKRKIDTTFDRWMRDPSFKKTFQTEYQEFLLSELVLALMENDHKSVRVLAKESGISPTVIQNIRSGKQQDMKLGNFLNLASACGFHLVLEKDDTRIPVA